MPTDQILNQVLADFTNAATAYYPLLLPWGLRIVAVITFLQWGYMAVEAMRVRDLLGILDGLVTGLLRIGFVYLILSSAWDIGYALVQTNIDIGGVSGQSPGVLTPSGVFDLGLSIAGALLKARTFGMWLHPVDDAVFLVICVFIILIWAGIAVLYLLAMLDALWAYATGPIIICWASLEYTWPTLMNWFCQVLQAGVKVLAILLVLAVGLKLANIWSIDLTGMGASINPFRIYYANVALVESIVLFYLSWWLPGRSAAMIAVHMGRGAGGGGEIVANQMINAGRGMVGGGGGAPAAKSSQGPGASSAMSGDNQGFSMSDVTIISAPRLGQYIQRQLT